MKIHTLRLDKSSLGKDRGNMKVKRDKNHSCSMAIKCNQALQDASDLGRWKHKMAKIASLLGNESHECISLKRRPK